MNGTSIQMRRHGALGGGGLQQVVPGRGGVVGTPALAVQGGLGVPPLTLQPPQVLLQSCRLLASLFLPATPTLTSFKAASGLPKGSKKRLSGTIMCMEIWDTLTGQ